MNQLNTNHFHILIVEDDKEIRDGIEIYLKNQGYQAALRRGLPMRRR